MPRFNLKLMAALAGSLAVAVCIFILAGTGATSVVAVTPEVKQSQRGPKLPTAPAVSHSVQAAEQLMATQAPPPAPGFIPLRTAMHPDLYKSLKSRAVSRLRQAVKPGGPLAALAPLAPPVLIGPNFNGFNSSKEGAMRPPDTHGAIGTTHFVEVTNSHVDMYRRTGSRAKSVTLNSFFKFKPVDPNNVTFDPRVVFDKGWNRWVITADAFTEPDGVQPFFIAVSQTADPTKAWWIYRIDDPGGAGNFWDFPMLGMDQDAVIISANVFDSGDNFIDCEMFAVAKVLLYNGHAFDRNMRTNLAFTTQPPIVLDQNPTTFLASADAFTAPTVVTLYALTNSSRDFASQTFTQSTINVPAFAAPPNAPQPGTAITLDTADARFVNASTQVGDSLFQVHSLDDGGSSTPNWYEFNTATNGINNSGTFFTAPTSFDFNASIAANANKDMFVTWTSVDATAGINAQARFTGRLSTDPGGNLGAGTALFTSPTFYTGFGLNPERWGDYSAVTIDPLDATKAWVVNQTILKNTVWSSRIGRVGF